MPSNDMLVANEVQGSAKPQMRMLLIVPAFLVVMAWRYRNNRPVFFVVVGSIFAVAALLVSVSNLPERILESLALGCMYAGRRCVWGMGTGQLPKKEEECNGHARPEKHTITRCYPWAFSLNPRHSVIGNLKFLLGRLPGVEEHDETT